METTYEVWMYVDEGTAQFTDNNGSPLIFTRKRAEKIAREFIPQVEKVWVIERRVILELKGGRNKGESK